MPIKILDGNDILARQRRLTQVGEIRYGTSEPVPGKSWRRPIKLSTFRITSQSEELVRAAAEIYGGKPALWTPQGGGRAQSWEVITEAKRLHIILPPRDEISQWMEHWEGGRPVRRCDSERITTTGAPCVCDLTPGAPRGKNDCKPTSRANVMLYNPKTDEMLSWGVFKIESHGWNVADKVPLQISIIRKITPPGREVRATIRLVDGTPKMIENPRKPGEYALSTWKEVLFEPATGTAKALTGSTGLFEIEAGPAAPAAIEAMPTVPAMPGAPVVDEPAAGAPIDAEVMDDDAPASTATATTPALAPADVQLIITNIGAVATIPDLYGVHAGLAAKGLVTPEITAALTERKLALTPAPEPAETVADDDPLDVWTMCVTAAGSLPEPWDLATVTSHFERLAGHPVTEGTAAEFRKFLRFCKSGRE